MAKVNHGIHPLEVQRLNVKPEKEYRLPDRLLNKIIPLSDAERDDFGITPVDEARGEVGSPELAAMLTVNPHDYSEEQMDKASRLELWNRSREELKEFVDEERKQNELGVSL